MSPRTFLIGLLFIAVLTVVAAAAKDWVLFELCSQVDGEAVGVYQHGGIPTLGKIMLRKSVIAEVLPLPSDKCTLLISSTGRQALVVGSFLDVKHKIGATN